MSIDLRFVELTADVLEIFLLLCTYTYIYVCLFLTKRNDPSHFEKTHPHSSMLQKPTMQLAKIIIDPKFVELTADVLEIFL